MPGSARTAPIAAILIGGVIVAGASGCRPHAEGASRIDPCAAQPPERPAGAALSAERSRVRSDLSGCARTGVASFYARRFGGREMADGKAMDPKGDNAASRTLPLGTVAQVTNLVTGQSAVVRIEDRGPYAKGRIVDLSPATARKIGITRRQGIAPVRVAPIAVPLADGRVLRGAAASASGSVEIDR